MFGAMDDDGFYYVRMWGWGCAQGGSPGAMVGSQVPDGSPEGQASCLPRWERRPQAVPPGASGSGGAVEAPLGLVSPASPPQGELNGQRGLVPSNFLEGPGPEAGGSDREPGAAPSEGQVSEDLGSRLSSWVSTLRRGRGAAACSGPGAHGAQEGFVPTARGCAHQPG